MGGADDPGQTDDPGVVSFTPDLLSRIGLYAHPRYQSLCGDYWLHVVRDARPHYQHYWLIDEEAWINTNDLQAFFTRFDGHPADLLAAQFGPRDEDWGWAKTMQPLGMPPHGALLTMARLSRGAIDHLGTLRRTLSADPDFAGVGTWPHDMAFVATVLAHAGFLCSDLNETGPPCYNDDSLRLTPLHDRAALADMPMDGLIYYPVRSLNTWLDLAETTIGAVRRHPGTPCRPPGLRTAHDAAFLDRISQACLDRPKATGAALVPLMLAQDLWQRSPWQPGAATDPDSVPAKRARRRAAELRRHFAPNPARPALATAHLAACNLPRDSLEVARPDDFVLGPPQPLGLFPADVALPYAFDMAARELLMTLHVSLCGVLDQTFLYTAQRDRTRVVARVPLGSLPRIYGPPDPQATPVLIFSLGRTGSTLFQKLVGCVTARSISEPDTLTQLANDRAGLLALPEDVQRAMVYYAIAPLFDIDLPHGGSGRCMIKMRSHVNVLSTEIAQTFPAAKYVFMLREPRAWARSFFRAFNVQPANAVERLLQWLGDLRRLQQSGVDLSIIHYESMVADPYDTVARLTGADPRADATLAARIAKVAAADSQAGNRLSRARTSVERDDERDWLASFDAHWARRRPGKLIEAIGVEL